MENPSQKLVAEVIKETQKNIYCWIWPCGDVSLLILCRNHHKKIQKLQNPNILGMWFTELRIPVSTFRNVYVNEAYHVTKSDLNSELKMAATIMVWFSRGIPFGIGQSMRKWNILSTSIKTW